MKHIKTFFIALSTAALLSGCGGKASWEQVSYKRELSDGERVALVEKIYAATTEKLSKYEVKRVADTKTELTQEHTEIKGTTEFFLNGEAYGETTTKVKAKEDAETLENETKYIEAYAQYDKGKYAIFGEDSEDGFDYNQVEVNEDYPNFAVKQEMQVLLGIMNGFKAVEDKKGNPFFVVSEEIETYTPDPDYTNSTKVRHDIERNEGVVRLNKDFSIKSISMYDVAQSNWDPSTHKYSNKVKTLEESSVSYSFTYGKRVDGSKKLSSYRDTAKNGYMLGNYNLNAKALKQDGTELANVAFNKIDEKSLSFSKMHLVYRAANIPAVIGEDAVDLINIKFVGSAFSNSVEDPVEINAELAIGNLVKGDSDISLANGKLKMGKFGNSVVLEFDVETTAGGASFSNVVAYARA